MLTAIAAHGDRVAAGINAHGTNVVDFAGQVTGELWQTLIDLDAGGCPRYVVTEASGRGHWFHHEHDQHIVAGVCETVSRPVIANGGVKHIEDLHRLAPLAAEGLEAVVVGQPLADDEFTLAEALAAAEPRFDPYRWGPPQP